MAESAFDRATLVCPSRNSLSPFTCSPDSSPLLPRPAEDMQNIRPPPHGSVVNQVLPGRKAFYAGSDDIRCLARARMFAKQPETVCDPIDDAVGDPRTRSFRPIQKNLLQIALRIFRDSVTHYRLESSLASSFRPLAFTPSASCFNPSRPSYSLYLPASMDSIPARTRRRIPSSCSSVRSVKMSSAEGLASRTARSSSSSIRRSASRTTSLALLYRPLFTFFRT